MTAKVGDLHDAWQRKSKENLNYTTFEAKTTSSISHVHVSIDAASKGTGVAVTLAKQRAPSVLAPLQHHALHRARSARHALAPQIFFFFFVSLPPTPCNVIHSS